LIYHPKPRDLELVEGERELGILGFFDTLNRDVGRGPGFVLKFGTKVFIADHSSRISYISLIPGSDF